MICLDYHEFKVRVHAWLCMCLQRLDVIGLKRFHCLSQTPSSNRTWQWKIPISFLEDFPMKESILFGFLPPSCLIPERICWICSFRQDSVAWKVRSTSGTTAGSSWGLHTRWELDQIGTTLFMLNGCVEVKFYGKPSIGFFTIRYEQNSINMRSSRRFNRPSLRLLDTAQLTYALLFLFRNWGSHHGPMTFRSVACHW